MVMAPLAVQSFAPYPQSEQQNVGLDRLVTLQRVLAHKGVPERVRARVRAEGVEPYSATWSQGRNRLYLLNDITVIHASYLLLRSDCAHGVLTPYHRPSRI